MTQKHVDEAAAHARAVAEYLHNGSDDTRRSWIVNFVYNLLAIDAEAKAEMTLDDIRDFGIPTTGKEVLVRLVGEATMQGAPAGYRGRASCVIVGNPRRG